MCELCDCSYDWICIRTYASEHNIQLTACGHCEVRECLRRVRGICSDIDEHTENVVVIPRLESSQISRPDIFQKKKTIDSMHTHTKRIYGKLQRVFGITRLSSSNRFQFENCNSFVLMLEMYIHGRRQITSMLKGGR